MGWGRVLSRPLIVDRWGLTGVITLREQPVGHPSILSSFLPFSHPFPSYVDVLFH